jgi:hypothetical protein
VSVADTSFDALADVLRRVQTRPLFVMQLAVRPYAVVGATPGVDRRIGVVTGGVFNGERLTGEVMDGGADWQAVRTDSSVTLDVRLVLRANDGALIAMTYRGVRHGRADVIARMGRGDPVDPAAYYFRIMPMFETAARQYDWLNRIVAVGIGDRRAEGPIYSVFEVL